MYPARVLRAAPNTGRALGWLLLAAVVPGCRLRMQPVRDAAFVEHPSVVSVVAWHSGLKAGVSSGVYVGPGTVLTCYHGVEGRSEVHVRLSDGRQAALRAVLGASLSRDLALLQVAPLRDEPAALALADADPLPGAALSAVGSAGGRAQTRTELRLRRVERTGPSAGRLRLAGAVGPGLSGAPVLDADGRVTAVIVKGTEDGRGGWAEPVSGGRALASGSPLDPQAWARASAPGPARRLALDVDAGWRALIEGEPAEAAEQAEGALARSASADPAVAEAAALLLGAALARTRGPAAADARLSRLVREQPAAWAARARMRVLLRLNRHAEALEAADEALRREPGDSPTRARRAEMLLLLGRNEAAEAEARAVLAADPGGTLARRVLVAALSEQGRSAEALPEALEAERREPDDLDARRDAGGALANAGRLEEARQRLEAVLAEQPDDAQAWAFLVRVQVQRGDAPAARAALAELERRDPAQARSAAALVQRMPSHERAR